MPPVDPRRPSGDRTGPAAAGGAHVSTAGGRAATGLAVIVCVHTPERLPVLRRAIAAVRSQLGPTDELVLVVDHHGELLGRLRADHPQLTVLPNTGPRGLSGARNSGVLATSAPVVVFLDDDAVPRDGWLRAWREVFSDSRVNMAGGAVRPAWHLDRPPSWLPGELCWVVGCDYLGMPPSGAAIRNPIGANMAVRRSALDAVGGFSALLGRVGSVPTGCEETQLGILVGRWGGAASVRRDTRPAVDHRVPPDRTTVRYLLRRCLHEGRSKRVLAGSVGPSAGLSSERAYVVRLLRVGLAGHLGRVLRGDPMGPVRALMLVLGVLVTGLGFVTGRPGPAVDRRGSAIDRRGPARVAARSPVSPLPGRPSVTAIVCTLGREPRLVDTVRALLDQTYPDLRVLVVDNDPTSGATDGLVAGLRDPRLTVLPAPARGLSRARNAGLAAADGDLVAFTDDDAVPDRTWIAALVGTFLAGGGRLGCVTGRVLAASRTSRWEELFERFGSFDKGSARKVWSLGPFADDLAQLGEPGPRGVLFPYGGGEFGSGNNMAFPRAVLAGLGGFDVTLGAGSPTRGGEDLDIFRTVLGAGWTVAYMPDAIVRHFHRDNERALRVQLFGYGTGMAAVLTKALVTDRSAAGRLIVRAPRALRVLLSPRSTKNAGKGDDYPVSLTLIELVGYLAGPWLWLRSRRQARTAAVGRPASTAAGPASTAGRPASTSVPSVRTVVRSAPAVPVASGVPVTVGAPQPDGPP